MKRILFLLLCIPVLGTQAQAIEIYVNDHKFDSLQAYTLWKKSAEERSTQTVRVNQKDLSDKAWHKIYVLSVENGVVGALQDFYRSWGQAIPRKISSEQLQEAIAQAVARSKYPKFIISEPGKVRIMALTTK